MYEYEEDNKSAKTRVFHESFGKRFEVFYAGGVGLQIATIAMRK